MELTGTIRDIHQTQTFGNNFQKREFILVTEEQYPQTLIIEISADRVDLLDKFNPGDNVIVGINIRGREWINPSGESKFFNSLSAWKITYNNL
ncbi:DUF3127 domain-containing protein [Chryseobacterium arthrosphaerae]|uniref:DUF3127 domain-containing protein n=1 Tax=Chryseobacterium arthrosphaerae TaxID=651561 RepID=UPI0024202352|nr:DUF3127 domain-containing protein [Chryseobacterium arthrosphaerae]